ncbi:MAG: hypothetical protein IH612_08900 [Desulfofustis sp.]|nr:hypothetical protein [Desulfofustis sp.]
MLARTGLTIALLIAALLGCSCAATTTRYLPVFTTTPRISTLGFSVLPPPGQNWYEKVNRDSLFYFKKMDSDIYSIATRATELHFSQQFPEQADFLAHVKGRKEISVDPSLITNVRLTFDVSKKSDRCIRYQQSYEDHRAEDSSASPSLPYTMVSNTGLICVHPDNDRIGIDLFYQERQAAGKPARSFANEGESFLNSLSFLSLEAQRRTTDAAVIYR